MASLTFAVSKMAPWTQQRPGKSTAILVTKFITTALNFWCSSTPPPPFPPHIYTHALLQLLHVTHIKQHQHLPPTAATLDPRNHQDALRKQPNNNYRLQPHHCTAAIEALVGTA
jgi:hypothetical protein